MWFRQILETHMSNAIVACSVALTLTALYWLSKFPGPRPRSSKGGYGRRVLRLFRISIHRGARRNESWLAVTDPDPRRLPDSITASALNPENIHRSIGKC